MKALADIQPIAIDDADSVMRTFHRSPKLGKEIDMLPKMTAEERALFAQKEKEIAMSEKRELEKDAEIPLAKKVKNGVTT